MSVILATWEAEIGRITLEASLSNNSQDTISKITRAKWTGVTQAKP
jgi:hypothetical protein